MADAIPKPAIKSTQNWMNIAMMVLAFVPGVKDIVAENPELALSILGVLNMIWRTFITKKPISGVV